MSFSPATIFVFFAQQQKIFLPKFFYNTFRIAAEHIVKSVRSENFAYFFV
jgi:hypothetical protein